MQVTKETINGLLVLKVVLTSAREAVLFERNVYDHWEYDTPVYEMLLDLFPDSEMQILKFEELQENEVIVHIHAYLRHSINREFGYPKAIDAIYNWINNGYK